MGPLTGYGAGPLTQAGTNLRPVLGVDLGKIDAAITLGAEPTQTLRLLGGLDANIVRARLVKLGAKPRTFGSAPGLSFGRDGAIQYGGQAMAELRLQSQLCVLPQPGQQEAVRNAFRQRLALRAVIPTFEIPISDLASSAVVSNVGRLVRVTTVAPLPKQPWLLFQTQHDTLLPYWDGSCSADAFVQKTC